MNGPVAAGPPGPQREQTVQGEQKAQRAQTAQGAHFPCFDGLRAFAAIAVVFHHASIATGFAVRGPTVPFTNGQNLGAYFAHMDVGVQVFFLISGFLLYRPYVAAAFDDRVPVPTRTFLWRRFMRIYPAYWVAFIGIAVMVGIRMPVPGARSMFEYFFLVHLYDPAKTIISTFDPIAGTTVVSEVFRALGGISQSWTLVVEVSFYLFVPAYAALLRRLGRGRDDRSRLRLEILGLVALYAISVLWRLLCYGVAAPGSALRFLGVYWLPANLDLFAMGMGLALASVWVARYGAPRLLRLVGSVDWVWWVVAFVCFHAATYWIGLSNTLVLVHGSRAFTRQLLYGMVALFLLLPAVFGPAERGTVRRFLQLRPVVFLGTISYGIYLWHQAFIEQITEVTNGVTFRSPFLPAALGALAMSVIVATVSFRLVEQPLLRLAHGRRAFEARDALRFDDERTRARHRLAGFDGLRAIAALMIVVLHVTSTTGATTATVAGHLFSRLDVGVTVFFVISGFLLYRPFVAAHVDGFAAPSVWRYAWRRGIRIFPAYWFALGAVILLFAQSSLSGPADVFRHLFLVQIYQPAYGLGGIVPAWTLAVELSFYAFLPLYAWVVGGLVGRVPERGARVRAELVAAGLLVVLAYGVRIWLAATRGTDAVSLRWLPANLDWFAAGIILAVLAHRRTTPVPANVRRAAWPLAGLALIVVSSIGLPVGIGGAGVAEDLARQLLYTVVAVGLVLPVALAPAAEPGAAAPPDRVLRLLSGRVLGALGVMSYGIFLWHFDWAEWLAAHVLADLHTLRTPVLLVLTLVVSVLSAAVSWFAIERPALGAEPPGRAPASPGSPSSPRSVQA